MKIGTKSVLFGVHAFWFHPFCVALAWRSHYRSWPRWWEWVAIFLHDTPGYLGKPNIDGPEGQLHPIAGAHWTRGVVSGLSKNPELGEEAGQLALLHSRHYAQRAKQPVSRLFIPDKLAVLFDPIPFYLLRGKLSGEIAEFRFHAEQEGHRFNSDREWLKHYRAKIINMAAEHRLKNSCK